MKRSKIVFACVCLFVFFAALSGCNNALNNGKPSVSGNAGGTPSTPSTSKSSEKTLLEFMFEEAKVHGLRGDVYGTVDEGTKTVSVRIPAAVTGMDKTHPTGIDITKLKASFKVSAKAKLFVGSAEQQSGKSENDFTASVIYIVKAEDGTEQKYTVKVEEAEEKLLSDLPSNLQKEIEKLYGYYWAGDGNKHECPAINGERLAVYTDNEFMSMGFENFRWSKISPSMWVCYSYASDFSGEVDYSEKRIVFTFVKDSNGTLKVFDTITRMSDTYGPYIKGKEPETVVEGGKTYYRYDSTSPKLFEPRMQ